MEFLTLRSSEDWVSPLGWWLWAGAEPGLVVPDPEEGCLRGGRQRRSAMLGIPQPAQQRRRKAPRGLKHGHPGTRHGDALLADWKRPRNSPAPRWRPPRPSLARRHGLGRNGVRSQVRGPVAGLGGRVERSLLLSDGHAVQTADTKGLAEFSNVRCEHESRKPLSQWSPEAPVGSPYLHTTTRGHLRTPTEREAPCKSTLLY